MERIVVVSLIVASISYIFGYLVRGYVDRERMNETRGQMGLVDEDIPDECYSCIDINVPCDPNCRYNVLRKGKELKVHVKSEKNDSKKN